MPDTFFGPNDPFPPGAITMWHGDPGDLPDGWLLCDGNNGTPNLHNRFPKSVPDSATDPGTTGGEHSKTLLTGQLPSHSHGSASTATDGTHSHGVNADMEIDHGTDGSSFDEWEYTNRNYTISSAGSHSHTLTTDTEGRDYAYDNQPPFFGMVFIQKA